jgi:hypothetical protein
MTSGAPGVEGGGCDGSGELAALSDVTAGACQCGQDLLGLHTLGDTRDAEAVADVDDASHDSWA